MHGRRRHGARGDSVSQMHGFGRREEAGGPGETLGVTFQVR